MYGKYRNVVFVYRMYISTSCWPRQRLHHVVCFLLQDVDVDGRTEDEEGDLQLVLSSAALVRASSFYRQQHRYTVG
jgi:hypothetical protein